MYIYIHILIFDRYYINYDNILSQVYIFFVFHIFIKNFFSNFKRISLYNICFLISIKYIENI